jgi:hypothetical protein
MSNNSKSLKVLSWDVGIYNLSYCILEKLPDSDKIKILDWDIINLVDNEEMKKNRPLIFENIPRKLHEKPNLLDVDIVVIENQPSLKNPQMKSIQMILYSYFLILGKIIGKDDGNQTSSSSYIEKIDFCSASNKLKIYDGPEIILDVKPKKQSKKIVVEETVVIEEQPPKKKSNKLKYSDKKKLAIEHAKYYIEKNDIEKLQFFNDHKKKDDLADSYLQGLYYIKKNY